MILDASFLIAVLRGDVEDSSEAMDVIEGLDDSGTATVASVSVMELWEGIHLADSTAAERRRVEALLTGLHELPFDRECAMLAGEINADLVSRGEPIEEADVMIGATALVHDEPVLTRNAEHFDRIDGVTVEQY